MHGILEADKGKKPALRPKDAIGPALHAIATHVLAGAHTAISDPERSSQEAVHAFRRAMKQWRALMRLLAPFIPDAGRWRVEARDHARSLAHARDGQAALMAFDDLIEKAGLVLSKRTTATVHQRLEALRSSEERTALSPGQREAIIAWLESAAAAVEQWPVDPFDFAAIAAQLTATYRNARKCVPTDWSQAMPEDLHALRRRVVYHRYQMELIEPLWPRFGRMWTEEAERLRGRLGKVQDLAVLERLLGPHQPLAHWRSRLVPACTERRAALSDRAARIARRLFAEKPKAFRDRLEMLWENGR
jgi:CHAD domain-containing protein